MTNSNAGQETTCYGTSIMELVSAYETNVATLEKICLLPENFCYFLLRK